MKMPKDDVLNALVTDLVADQIIRALELGYSREEVTGAVEQGMNHGTFEFNERQRRDKETERAIRKMGRPKGRR